MSRVCSVRRPFVVVVDVVVVVDQVLVVDVVVIEVEDQVRFFFSNPVPGVVVVGVGVFLAVLLTVVVEFPLVVAVVDEVCDFFVVCEAVVFCTRFCYCGSLLRIFCRRGRFVVLIVAAVLVFYLR